MGKMQRDKGARFERTVSAILNEYGITSRRGNVFYREDDVVTDSPIHVECKAQETTKIHEWMKQSIEAADGKIPVVVHKRNREEPLITMKFEDFLKLWKGEK